MLSDRSELLKQQRLLYINKNALLNQFYEQIEPYDFYRYIFPEGAFERKGHYEDNKPNAIAVTIEKKYKENGIAVELKRNGKGKRYTITDNLDELNELNRSEFTIMSPISYYGKQRNAKNARYLYALVFDLDGVDMPQLRDVLHQMNTLPRQKRRANYQKGCIYHNRNQYGRTEGSPRNVGWRK